MDLDEAFRNHKEKIVGKWVEYTLATYSSSGFFLREHDRFANPIGGNVREALAKLFTLLVRNAEVKEMMAPLEQLISIRAVQDFSPSQAVAPLNAIKHITREVLAADKERKHLVQDLYDFEFAVDLVMLTAFDLYMTFRERLYKVRIDEIKSGSHLLTDSKCPSRMLSADTTRVSVKVSSL
jgi:RsbT co-antagonist protein rsbRD N-terminal domain